MILKEDILSKVSEKDIMEFYWQEKLEENKAIYRNPTRSDTKGSCYFKWSGSKYNLIDRSGDVDCNLDCFNYVKWIYGCNFYEALQRINSDMMLKTTSKIIKSSKVITKTIKRRSVNFKITTRRWSEVDVKFWGQYGIKIDTISKICQPVQQYLSDSGSFTFRLKYQHSDEDPCYVYKFKKTVKLYQPYSKTNKWRSNSTSDDVFGYDNLPHFGSDLYICSGAKDMFAMWTMGFNAIAPQSEAVDVPENIMDDLKVRFRNIYYLFDSDSTGLKMSEKFAKKNGVDYITIPKIGECKDVAELCKTISLHKTKNIINENRKTRYDESRRIKKSGV